MNTALHIHPRGDPEHPPLVLLHGFMGRASDWDEVAEVLSADYYCLAIDLPGHGASLGLPAEAYTFAGAVHLIHQTLARAVPRPVILAGYSMGARLALGLTVAQPDLVQALVLESGSPGLDSEKAREQRRHDDTARAEALKNQGLPAFLEGWYDQPLFAALAQHPGLREALIRKRLENHTEELAAALTGLSVANQSDYRDDLPDLNRPLLVLAGMLDSKYVGLAREIQGRHARCRLELIPDAGHNIHLENPRAFVQVLRSFAHEIET